MDNVLSSVLAILQEGAAITGTLRQNYSSYGSRDAAYEIGMRQGLVFDATQNGLVHSRFNRVTGITSRGRSLIEALLVLRKIDDSERLASILANVFIPLTALAVTETDHVQPLNL